MLCRQGLLCRFRGERRRPDVTRPGEIIDEAGTVIGTHKGLVNHTVGQAKGIGIAGPQLLVLGAPSLDTAQKSAHGRIADTGGGTSGASRWRATLTSGFWPQEPISCQAMVRYRGHVTNAIVTFGYNGIGNAMIFFDDDTAKLPIASPGQAIVFSRW